MKYPFLTSDNKLVFIGADCQEKATLEAQLLDRSAQPIEDLFEYYYLLPLEVQMLLNRYSHACTYEELELFLRQINDIGYTFEYYLDAAPFGLRKV